MITYNPQSENGKRWVENLSDGLRVRPFHEVLDNPRHTGWYVDEFRSEVAVGAVVYLPHGLCVPAVADPWNDDAYIVDFNSISDDRRAVAFWADQMAEHWAEESREHDRKSQLEFAAEEAMEEINQLEKLSTEELIEEGKQSVANQIASCKRTIEEWEND